MSSRPAATRLLLLALAVACASCATQADPPDEAEGAAQAPAATADDDSRRRDLVRGMMVKNASFPAPDILSAGQLGQTHIEALRTLGYDMIISLRPEDEEGTGWEEEYTVMEGIPFRRIPVTGADGLTRQNVDALAGAMAASESATVIYCASGNRVGALLALKAFWIDGRTPEESLQFGLAAGLTGLEPEVRKILELPAE